MAVDKMGLRALLLEWYAKNDISAAEGRRRLETLTGVSARTLERVEQEGSFRYPKLLKLALQRTDNKVRP